MNFPDHKKNLLILLFVLSCIFCCGGCGDEETVATTEQLMEQAFNAANGGRWDIALQYSAQAYKNRPDDVSVRIMHALALENNGQENEALEISRSAAEDKTSFLAQYTYGRMLFQRERYEQAMQVLKSALALRSDDFNTLLMLQQAAAILNHPENKKYYSQLWRLYGSKRGADFKAYIYNEGSLHFLRTDKRSRNVERGFLEALKAAPDSPQIMLNLAIYYDYYCGNYQKAEPFYKRFLFLTENHSGMLDERNRIRQRESEIQRKRRAN